MTKKGFAINFPNNEDESINIFNDPLHSTSTHTYPKIFI